MADLWRVLVPSWRFFDRVGARPRVFVREDDWLRTLTAPPRRWFTGVFNPYGNLQHADQNLIERLLEEIVATDGSASAVARLTSYQILEQRLRQRHPAATEFKIVVNDEDVVRAHLSPAR